jgi:hypothetical protein
MQAHADRFDPVMSMLNQIRDAGFDGIGGLLLAMMDSDNNHIRRRFSNLVASPTAVRFASIVHNHGLGNGSPLTKLLTQIDEAGINGIDGFLHSMMESREDPVQRKFSDLIAGPTAARFATMVHEARNSTIIDKVVAEMTREADVIRKDKQCQIGSKGVTPEFIRAFSFQSLGLRFAALAPTLWRLVCSLGDISQDTANQYLESPPEGPEELEEPELEDPEPLPNSEARPNEKKHKAKEKVLAAIMVISELAFTRSRNCNAMQMMIGYYLFSTRTGKRVIGVLNHLGISVSYDTVRLALQANAVKVQALITQRAQQEPIALTYDNLVTKHHAATETLLNKSHMQNFTACGVIFLKLTSSLAERLGKSTDTPAPERYLPGETSEAARARRRRPAPRKDNNPGLSTSLLIKPNPDWASLKAADIVNVEADQKYWSLVAKALMCRVLKKYFPNEMKQSEKEARIAPISMPQLYKITPGASDMYTLATLDIDEGTIDGNIDVLETVATEQLGLTLDGMADGRLIPTSGDQMTVARIVSGQFLRTRDFPEHRMLWVKTLSGMLHTRMALIHAIYLSHPGRPDGRDPASLSKFVKLLGRTKIKEGCPNLNASHELLQQVGEGHVLAALIERTNAGGLDGLRAKVASGQWKSAVDSIVDDDWLRLDFVDRLREDARNGAEIEVGNCDDPPVPGETRKHAETREKKAKKDEESGRRDIAFENALLLMQQALLYEDYHDALRCGDSGRLERSSDMLCVMFQGLSKLKNYRHLSLDFKASRVKEWTEEMRELWLLNCVVNLTGKDGKFLAIDEFNEWIVRAVKDVYNTSGTIQSSNFTLNVVSPNVIPLHHASRKVLESSGAPTYGYKHARVDDTRDVKAIVSHLLDEKVFCYTPGRESTIDEDLRSIPSTDLYSTGVDAIRGGVVLERYIEKKLALIAGELGGFDDEGAANLNDVDAAIEEQEGLFSSREPRWSFDEESFSLEDWP